MTIAAVTLHSGKEWIMGKTSQMASPPPAVREERVLTKVDKGQQEASTRTLAQSIALACRFLSICRSFLAALGWCHLHQEYAEGSSEKRERN